MLQGEVAKIMGGSGVEVRVFRPFRTIIGMRLRVLRRLHRKLCVVDGCEAYAGGINVLDDRVDPRHGLLDAPRLDFALRVVGPLVADIDQAMRRLWHEADSGSPLERFPGPVHPAGEPSLDHRATGFVEWATFESIHAALVLRDNVRNRRTIERVYLRALGRARREVLIASAYFLPGRRFRQALCAAARRGVRVRLLLQGRVEYRLPHLGTLSLYESRLREGVEIIEYGSSFLHAKVAIADDWATVGSANIDPFSLLLAREANVVVRSRSFAEALQSRLEREIAIGGQPVGLDRLAGESSWRRLLTRAAWLMMRIGVAISGSGLRY
jgi:cardiolipin synthase